MRKSIACLTLAAALAAPAVLAKDKKDKAADTPEAFKQVVACRQIADDKERLACYDRQVAGLDAAQQAGQVVVVDKQQVEQTEKSLFGFNTPKSALTSSDSKPLDQIDGTLASARQYDVGKWRLTMDDGSVWEQVDASESLAFDPRPGDKVVIKRATFGSFKARIDGQPAIRVRRVQ